MGAAQKITLSVALMSMALLAYAEEKEQEEKEETQQPIVIVAIDLSEDERRRLDAAIEVAGRNRIEELKAKAESLETAYPKFRRGIGT